MIRNSLLFSILALVPSSGCFALGPSIGIDANHRRAAGFLDVDAMIASDDPTLPFGLTTRMRAGVTLFDLGLGLVGCKTTASTSFGLCGRVMLLEVGTFEGEGTWGLASPSLYGEFAIPIRDPETGKSPIPFASVITIKLGGGLDVRPPDSFSQTLPYAFAGAGFVF